MPRADDFPPMVVDTRNVPTTSNPPGVKGGAETGTVGVPAAVIAAIVDALAPLGVREVPMPATPFRVWQAISGRAGVIDGFIAGADTRYLYNFWRPITAIRAQDAGGNGATTPDPVWESYVNTPPLPDYPSTHSILGAGAAAVMAGFFGSDQIAFTMTSGAPFAGISRSFTSLSQAARENADSRVWAGIHFRSACQGGLALGEKIGRRAFAEYLRPYGAGRDAARSSNLTANGTTGQ